MMCRKGDMENLLVHGVALLQEFVSGIPATVVCGIVGPDQDPVDLLEGHEVSRFCPCTVDIVVHLHHISYWATTVSL